MTVIHNQEKRNTPYFSFDEAMKQEFGGKVYRLSLSASHSCPNRDGTCGTGGCIFCSAGGSGDFAEDWQIPVTKQIELAKARVQSKLSRNFAGYMAYFQSFTETYGNQQYLVDCFLEAATKPEILALSIGTRPDCITDWMLLQLQKINAQKPVFVELGLQTIHEDIAAYINRGYPLSVFEETFHRLKEAGLRVVVHVIIGLPGEDEARTIETVQYLANLRHGSCQNVTIDGIKLSLLHVLKGTKLAELLPSDYEEKLKYMETSMKTSPENADAHTLILNDGKFLTCYNISNYADLLTRLVSLLPREIAIHRMTGDAPKQLLLMPKWTADKKRVLNTITKTFTETGRHQI